MRVVPGFLTLLALCHFASAQQEVLPIDPYYQPQKTYDQRSLDQVIRNAQSSNNLREYRQASKLDNLRNERQRLEDLNQQMLEVKLEESRVNSEQRLSDRVVDFQAETGGPAMVQGSGGYGPGYTGTSVAPMPVPEDYSYKFAIAPRGGISHIPSSNLDVSPDYSLGVAVEFAASNYFTLEAGYSRNRYSVGLLSSNPYVATTQVNNAFYSGDLLHTLLFEQNVFDVGIKVHMMNQQAAVRPFLSLGGGYSSGSIDLKDDLQNYMNNYYGGYYGNGYFTQDYDVDQWVGYAGLGLEFRIVKPLSLSIMGRYYHPFSSDENFGLPTMAFVNPYYYTSYQALDKRYAAISLKDEDFFTVHAGATLQF